MYVYIIKYTYNKNTYIIISIIFMGDIIIVPIQECYFSCIHKEGSKGRGN